MQTCTHLDQIRDVEPSAQGCDSSKNKHATKHYHGNGRPIVASFEPGEDWRWYYADEALV